METIKPVVLFDGVCNLCNYSVRFIDRFAAKNTFHLISLQSEQGMKLRDEYAISGELDTVILIRESQVFLESEAVVEILNFMPFPWNALLVIKVFPLNFRNAVYRWIAKNRYRWFGKRENCQIGN